LGGPVQLTVTGHTSPSSSGPSRVDLAWAVEAVIMGSRRKPRYSGLLNQPIFRLPGLWGTHLLVRDRKAKLELLLKHYGVELSDRSGLQKLAIFLALDHVPGMKVADFLPKKGAGLRWDVEHSQRFVELIDQIMSEKNCGRADAIRFAIQRAKSNKDVSGVIRFATERKKLSGNKVIEVLSNRYRLAKIQIKENARRTDKLKDALPLAEGVRRMLEQEK
jgi:hypothetical protein